MTIYHLYIFDKFGTMLYYAEWNRTKKSGVSREEVGFKIIFIFNINMLINMFFLQEAKLTYGMLFSIKSFVSKISPHDPREGFLYYKTNRYALHYMETPSGLKYLINYYAKKE